MLRQCDDIESFLSASDDRFIRCPDFAAWRRAPNLFGVDAWGEGTPANLERRARIIDHFTAPGCAKQRMLFDCSGCRDSSPFMYTDAARFWMSRRERHAAAFDKAAVVVTNSYIGALVAGLTVLVDPGYALRRLQSLEAALAWLGEADAGSLAAELQGLRPPEEDDAAVLRRLQQLLEGQDLCLDVSDAARRLGMSPRTLQRRLSTARTTFQAELLRAKLARATKLMLTGRYTMTAIAFDLGFASPQHFSSRFAAIYGEPPSTWLRNYHAAEGGR